MLRDPTKRPDDKEMDYSYTVVESLRNKTKRPSNAEKSLRSESPGHGPSPDYEEEDMTRPKFEKTDEEHIAYRAREDRSAALLKNQIHQAEARKLVRGTDSRRNVDPLGTLIRARTMSIVPAETKTQIATGDAEDIRSV
jgi:hypothetical protein